MSRLTEPAAELHALATALGGRPPPCAGDPEQWFTDPAKAVHVCRTECHARTECGDYAAAVQPSHGVWAGTVRITRPEHHSPRHDPTERKQT